MSNIKIKGVKCTEIEWCVEPIDTLLSPELGYSDEEIEKAIEEIEASLPQDEYVPLPHISNDFEYVKKFVTNLDSKLSDKYGYLINSFNYKLIGIDDNEYDF